MPTTTETNGSVRKTLASQLDRLDAILDGLSENLNDAVVTAVRAAVVLAVQEAGQAALTELRTNPALQQRLRPTAVDAPAAAPATRSPGWGSRLLSQATTTAAGVAARARQVRAALQRGWSAARDGLNRVCQRVADRARSGWLLVGALAPPAGRRRQALLAALGVGAAVALGCYLAGPVVAAGVSGLAGFTAALAAGAVGSCRHLLPLDDTAASKPTSAPPTTSTLL
jgi:hypothetical protein